MRNPLLPFFAAAGLLVSTAIADIESSIDTGLAFAEEQLAALPGILGNSSRFMDYSNTSGVWQRQSRASWCSGFAPGMFWYMYDHTGDEKWRTWARNWTNGVRARSTEADNDTGFQIYCSFGNGYLLSDADDDDYWNVMQTAATTFATQRFNPTIGAYRAWTNSSSDPVGSPRITAGTTNPNTVPFEVNIDMLMNLELPLFVGTNGGDPAHIDRAVAHADTTWDDLVRQDGSHIHVIGYRADGSVDYARTHQGWTPDSTWSRGQAWGVYGYAMVYRYTRLPRMLERSEAMFDYFMAATAAQTSDYVPYSDFDAPLNSLNPRDTSAAAIVAAAAMDLYEMTSEAKYLTAARNIIESLSSSNYLAAGTSYQPILRKASSKWGDPEVGASFADYYYVEAMLRHREQFPASSDPSLPMDPGTPVDPDSPGGPTEPVVPPLTNLSTRGMVGESDARMIAGFVIAGNSPIEVLIRGVGPTLLGFGVNSAIADPQLELFAAASSTTPTHTNNDWSNASNAADIAATATRVGAFALPADSADAALLLTLEPGIYTVQLSNNQPGSGRVGLVEVYWVPPTE
jgi:unsaturated chondroitin disaccharide hydrolase